jgi:phosphonate transport system substrate-binding protein
MQVQLLPRLVLLCLLAFLALTAHGQTTWTVGIVPQFPPEQIFRTWSPILKALSRLTNERFELHSFNSIPEFETAFLNGEVDLAYMNPYHAVMAREVAGYIPIVRDGKRRLSGILVVRRDSPITDVRQLDGATVAFPAPNAFGASLYMRALLAEREQIKIEPTYVKTHSNVYRHVVNGRAQAGGGVRRTFERETPELQAQLRVVYQTPDTYPHPLAAHPRMPANVRAEVQAAFLRLAEQPATATLLEAIQIAEPVVASHEDYAELAELGLESFVVIAD